jgi:hypothetical protein
VKGARGASIFEVAVTALVIAVMVSGIGTALYSTTLSARDQSALDQLERIKAAIIGVAASETGSRHGFIEDIGTLPASLNSLDTIGALPDYTMDSNLQIGAGWRGPYIAPRISAAFNDPWGSALVYSTAAGTSAVTGAAIVGTIRSIGADGANGTADDHVVEIYKSEAFTTLNGYVKDLVGAVVPGVSVQLSYPSNGVITSATVVTDNSGFYSFTDVPRGPGALELTPKLTYRAGSGVTTGNNRNNLEFVIENLGRNAISVTSIKMTWATTPASDFKRLLIDGMQLFSGTVASGTTLTISPAANLAGTGVIREPLRIDVAGQAMIVPDAVLGTVGDSGAITVVLEDFEETGNNNNVDVTGVNFTVEFSDGSETAFLPVRQ